MNLPGHDEHFKATDLQQMILLPSIHLLWVQVSMAADLLLLPAFPFWDIRQPMGRDAPHRLDPDHMITCFNKRKSGFWLLLAPRPWTNRAAAQQQLLHGDQ